MKEVKINVPDGYEIDKDKSTFENIVFKKKDKLPKSFFDLGGIKGYYVTEMCNIDSCESTKFWNQSDRNVFKTKEQAEASIALAQLSQLRDVYRQGWVPDWSDIGQVKFCIYHTSGAICVLALESTNFFLSFQDRETAELFLENFRDLIEQAKPLMS